MFPPLYIYRCSHMSKHFIHSYWCLSLTEMCFDESLHPDCLSRFQFTVWFPCKQHMHSALFHHLHPWSQVCSRGAKRQSSQLQVQVLQPCVSEAEAQELKQVRTVGIYDVHQCGIYDFLIFLYIFIFYNKKLFGFSNVYFHSSIPNLNSP